jgi:subtilisin-like proprotein convertase family protein
MYVVGYRQRREVEPLVDPRRPWENVDVQFSPIRGDWLMEYNDEAQRELGLLTSLRVRVNDHYCQLELEEKEGTFAIICREHPDTRV